MRPAFLLPNQAARRSTGGEAARILTTDSCTARRP